MTAKARRPAGLARRLFLPATLAGLALPAVGAAGPPGSPDDPVQQGRYLLHAGGCYACHTDTENDGPPLAGGRRLETSFGVFFSPNITPDEQTGIGSWNDAQFLRSLREGVAASGAHYYPAFPYPAYTRMRRDDALAIKAYLDALDAVTRENRPHELPWYLSWRPLLWLWKWLHLETGELQPDPSRDDQWNRGAYLTEALGHCDQCHSPRTLTGGLDEDLRYAGTADGPEGELVPNITSDPQTGIGKWNDDEIFYLLKYGELPDGDYVGGSMAEVVDYSTSKLTDEDLRAMVSYLKTLPPVRHDPGGDGGAR